VKGDELLASKVLLRRGFVIEDEHERSLESAF
jgi:hypothetical protein